MSSNPNDQQQQQHQQQQFMNFYSQQAYQPQQFNNNNNNNNNNTYFPNNMNNFYQGNNQMNLQQPINYYQQQQQIRPQLYNVYQPQQTQPIQSSTLQQFNEPVIPTEPDDFIIDLLKKPQERLFLLKVEMELETFIKDETKLRLDFPNMNSYQRLMIHRLAPYYKLNHYHDAMRKGVYVCKTFITELPSVRLPDVQIEDTTDVVDDSGPVVVQNISSSNESMPQFKIMRRETGSSDSSPRSSSNALNSEQAKADRKNMTFEERKTAYEEARARIFQGLETEKS